MGRILSDLDQLDNNRIDRKISLLELVDRISSFIGDEKEQVVSGNRRQRNCQASELISFIAAKRMGYKFNNIAGILSIHPVGQVC